MKFTVSQRVRSEYPESGFVAISAENIINTVSIKNLKGDKDRIEENIRDGIILPKTQTLDDYFKKYKKTYPVSLQVASVKGGKDIPSVLSVVEAMFMTELEHGVLISGHNMDELSNVSFDLTDGGEEYILLNGKKKKTAPNDIVLKNGNKIIASIVDGPSKDTSITKDTSNAVFFIWYMQTDAAVESLKRYLTLISKKETRISVIMPSESKDSFVVTPWDVKGDIDYERLVKQFGTKLIDDNLHKRIIKLAGEDHHMLRRKVFYSHMYLKEILDSYEKGEKFYLYTGRAPSGPIHLGHLVPWIFTKWLQDKLGVNLLFQIPDEEKFLFKDKLTFEDTQSWAYENILDIIAIGFDPEKTKIFLDTEYAGHMYKHACRVAKKITFSTIKSTFGFDNSRNIGEIFYTAMQSVPVILPSELEGKKTRVLIPCAIDQDVHFRLTRDVAESLGYHKPATILSRFLPGLQGMSGQGKMSSSIESTAIFTTDTPKQIKKKINKYAFSGGRDTVEEHRRLGGVPEIDVSYQWLTFFEEDDSRLEQIYADYKSGKILSGELKKILIDKISNFLTEHQKRREEAKKRIEMFMLRD